MYDDEENLPKLTPARIDERLKAGAFDLLVVSILITGYFGVPLLLGGLTLPIWGVFAAVVGYSVAPLALFRATLGMRLFGIEMVDKHGRNPQVTDLLFRELIGRGFFPIAYLGMLAVGLLGMILGVARFAMPAGFGFILFLLSSALLFVAIVGHFFALGRPDRRTLSDLMAKTWVVPRTERPLPEDADEREEALRLGRGRVRTLVITEILLVALGAGLPYLLTRPSPGESTVSYAERLKRQKLESQFAQDPTNAKLANELAWSWRNAGDKDQAEQVLERYRAALGERDAKREADLRALLTTAPDDRATVSALLELLEDQNRMDDAREVYRGWVDAAPTASRRAGFGIWLYQSGFSEPAVAELTKAIDEGHASAEAVAYRGFAYRDLQQPTKAKSDFEAALELDPTLEEVEIALMRLQEQPND